VKWSAEIASFRLVSTRGNADAFRKFDLIHPFMEERGLEGSNSLFLKSWGW